MYHLDKKFAPTFRLGCVRLDAEYTYIISNGVRKCKFSIISLLSNLKIQQKTVLPSLLAPFAGLVNDSKHTTWLPGPGVGYLQSK